MSREIPQPIRAAAGLAATVLDEARKLPETLPGLPVRVIGLAMQTALKVQQHYAGLVARGDELFTGLRGEDEPGMATFDDDEPAAAPPPAASARASAFDRAADVVPDEIAEEELLLDSMVDDEVSGLPADPAPEEVVEALQDITDQVAAVEGDAVDGDAVLTAEDALESALLEADGAAPQDQDSVPSDPGGSPVGEQAGAPDVTEGDSGSATGAQTTDAGLVDDAGAGDIATSVDVLTPDGRIETVEATVTDEGVAAPEVPTSEEIAEESGRAPLTAADAGEDVAATEDAGDTATDDTATAVDEGGTPVAAATGVRTDVGESDTAEESAAIAEGAAVDAVGEQSDVPTDDPEGGSELSGSQAAGTAPITGYDGFTVAQLRGRLRGYQLGTVQELLAYEESTRNRDPFVRMLRNRLEKLERQAVESSPLAPRGA
ncbi:hypothetical protein [Blastococcus sp. SYSU D00820]